MCLGILAAFYKCFFRVLRRVVRAVVTYTYDSGVVGSDSISRSSSRKRATSNESHRKPASSRRAGLGASGVEAIKRTTLEDLKRSLTRGA